jgi:hypothetical protein
VSVNHIVEEAQGLISGEKSNTLAFLAKSFITKRLQNSDTMESAKAKALRLLLDKLEDPDLAEQMRPGTLIGLIEMLGEQAGKDFKVVVDSQTSVAASKSQQASGGMSFFFSGAPQSEDPTPAQLPRSMYKLLDVLNQVSEAVVASAENKKAA